jgi:hypothetical protein
MVSVRVYCEGPGERGFVRQVLAPYLEPYHVYAEAAQMGHPGGRPSGGIKSWTGEKGTRVELKRAIRRSTSSYPVFVTTLVDYYRLPTDWPRMEGRSTLPVSRRAEVVQKGMKEDLLAELEDSRCVEYFIPYVSLHELEALILCRPEALLKEFPGCGRDICMLKEDIQGMLPEEINDGESTAPSKRIIRRLPDYAQRKSIAATSTLQEIGINAMIDACPHFAQWLNRLKSLGGM